MAQTNALLALAPDPSISVHSHPHRSAPPSQSEPAKAVATHLTHHGHRAHTSPQQRRLRRLHQPNWRRARGARASASIAIIPTEPASRPVVAPRLGRRAGHRASASSPTTEVTARAHIARARSDLVSKTEAPPEDTHDGSRWPRRAVERQCARCMTRATPCCVRGWLGLMPERPALCLTGLPRLTRVALSHHIHIYQRAGRSGSGIMRHAMSKIYFVISRETCGEEHTHTRRHSERERP